MFRSKANTTTTATVASNSNRNTMLTTKMERPNVNIERGFGVMRRPMYLSSKSVRCLGDKSVDGKKEFHNIAFPISPPRHSKQLRRVSIEHNTTSSVGNYNNQSPMKTKKDVVVVVDCENNNDNYNDAWTSPKQPTTRVYSSIRNKIAKELSIRSNASSCCSSDESNLVLDDTQHVDKPLMRHQRRHKKDGTSPLRKIPVMVVTTIAPVVPTAKVCDLDAPVSCTDSDDDDTTTSISSTSIDNDDIDLSINIDEVQPGRKSRVQFKLDEYGNIYCEESILSKKESDEIRKINRKELWWTKKDRIAARDAARAEILKIEPHLLASYKNATLQLLTKFGGMESDDDENNNNGTTTDGHTLPSITSSIQQLIPSLLPSWMDYDSGLSPQHNNKGRGERQLRNTDAYAVMVLAKCCDKSRGLEKWLYNVLQIPTPTYRTSVKRIIATQELYRSCTSTTTKHDMYKNDDISILLAHQYQHETAPAIAMARLLADSDTMAAAAVAAVSNTRGTGMNTFLI